MAKRKIKSRYDKVPCRSLCEKLPRDLFSDTEYVWFKDPEYDKRKGYLLCSRYLLQVVWGMKPKELIPAPTADELLEKLTAQWSLSLGDNPGGIYWAQLWSRSHLRAEQHGKNWPTMLCKCYLQYEKEMKRYFSYGKAKK